MVREFFWMRSLTKGIILFTMLLLAGFTVINEELKDSESNIDSKFKLLSNVVTEVELDAEKKSIIKFEDLGDMLTSWYGPKFHGRLTANGEIYDQMAFTAAHKTLRFGTLLKLTNPKNNATVIVRINDRGPYIGKRELDLSKGAATVLGMLKPGVVKLKVQEVSISDENQPLFAQN